MLTDIERVREAVRAEMQGGVPYLLAAGLVWLVAGLVAAGLSERAGAGVLLVQVPATVGFAVVLARVLRSRIRPLSRLPGSARAARLERALPLLGMAVPVAALPGLVAAWWVAPAAAPVVQAAVFAAHLLPGAWLLRSGAYAVLAAVVPVAALAVWPLGGPWLVGVMTGAAVLGGAIAAAREVGVLPRGASVPGPRGRRVPGAARLAPGGVVAGLLAAMLGPAAVEASAQVPTTSDRPSDRVCAAWG